MLEFFRKNIGIAVFIAFLVIGLGLYANSFGNQFFWDDEDTITNNIYIKNWSNFTKFFSKNLIAGVGQTSNYWRPVVLISFAIDYHVWGLVPIGFHLTNTIFHIICAWLIFIFLYKLFEQRNEEKKVSTIEIFVVFLVSLFFLVHPLQTEAITYVSGRADPLSAVFSILSLIFYINFRGSKKRNWLIYSILFFIFGLLTKEQVIFLPLLVLLIELFIFTKKISKETIKKTVIHIWPFFILSIFYFILRITLLNFNNILGGVKNIDSSYENLNIWQRLFTFSSVMLDYFKLLFIPIGLHMSREVKPILSFFSLPVISFIILLAAIIYICLKTWKKEKLISFGFLWFFIILIPRTNIIKINRPMYEHWLYLPMIGFFLALFLLILLAAKKIKDFSKKEIFETSFYTISIIFCIAFSILTILRNRDWRDPITFYEKNLKYTPNSYIQYNNLGMAYAQIGYQEKAIEKYKKAISIKDVYPQVHYNLGNSLIYVQKYKEAVNEYEKTIELSPTFAPAYQKLLSLYIAAQNKDEIFKLFDKMEKIFKDDIDFLNLKAEIYYKIGEREKFDETLKKINSTKD